MNCDECPLSCEFASGLKYAPQEPPGTCELTESDFDAIKQALAGEGTLVCMPMMTLQNQRLLNAILEEADVYEMKTICLCGETKRTWQVTDHSDKPREEASDEQPC